MAAIYPQSPPAEGAAGVFHYILEDRQPAMPSRQQEEMDYTRGTSATDADAGNGSVDRNPPASAFAGHGRG